MQMPVISGPARIFGLIGCLIAIASTAAAAPVVTAFSINAGSATSTSVSVTLNNTCTGSPTQYMASESSSFTGATWATYSGTPAFTLAGAVGTRTVYFKVRDASNVESAVVNDAIFVAPEMISVSASTFTMGRTTTAPDSTWGQTDEDPTRSVTLSAYQIGKFEMTNQQACDILNWAKSQNLLLAGTGSTLWTGTGNIYAGGTTGSRYLIFLFGSGIATDFQYSGGLFSPKTRAGLPSGTNYSMAKHPMQYASWYGAVAMANWLSQMQGLAPCYDMNTANWPLTVAPPTVGGYRLPTEAEWERAAAWNGTKHWIFGYTGDTIAGASQANYNVGPSFANPLGLTAQPYTSPVGWFNGTNVSPNGNVATINGVSPVGAYDMSGNLAEWVQDWYSATYYSGGAMTNPVGPATGTNKILRGGAWVGTASYARSADREGTQPPVNANSGWGVRLVRSASSGSLILTYTAGANGAISGTSPQSVAQGASGTAVTAVANTGYHFTQWSDGSTQNPRTDTNVQANITVTANFAINTYTLTYTAGSNGTITGVSPQTVNHGASGSAVTAVPNAGYSFTQWSDSSTQNPRTDTNVTANKSVTASFAALPVPVVSSFAINSGAASTTSAVITLNNTATNSPTDYQASESSSFTGASWIAYSATPSFTLSAGNGTKTVYFRARNGAGNSATVSDTITLSASGGGGEVTVTLPGSVPLVMVTVPAGSFNMGRYAGEVDSYSTAAPQHQVTFAQSFTLAKYELTKRQWQAIMGTTPWSGQPNISTDLDSPAVYISWSDAQSFVTALNTHITNTSQGAATFRLPSEAEWEYAARAGTSTRFHWGDDSTYTQISNYAWWYGTTWDINERYAHVVGLKQPNSWGFYDLHGNAWEWCQDYWNANYTGAPTNGSAWVSPAGTYRVLRGGGWDKMGDTLRASFRGYGYAADGRGGSVGLRLAR